MKIIIHSSILFIVFFFWSCNHEQNEKYIKVDSYKIIDNNLDYFLKNSEKEVIQIECSSNFPLGTFIVIGKGIRLNTTNQDLMINSSFADTIVLNQKQFAVSFSPSLITGYVSFTVFMNIQNSKIKKILTTTKNNSENRLYSVEYSIDYKKTKNSTSHIDIPELPIKLIIRKVN